MKKTTTKRTYKPKPKSRVKAKPEAESQEIMAEAIQVPSSVRKIAIICCPGLDRLLGEVANHFKANYEVKICITNNLETIFNAVKWADTVWIEWANQTAVDVTSLGHLMYQKQIILRLHSYEAFLPELDYIHWNYITDLIFVADHIKDLVLTKYPAIKKSVDRIHVIPSGIDTNRFDLSRDRRYQTVPGKNIAYLGMLNFKKGAQLMFNVFAELVRNDSEFMLHIGGAFQDPRYPLYLKQMQEKNPVLMRQIKFHGWIDDPVAFLRNKSHIICTSLMESGAIAVMEGMSMGLKPLIHNFYGANKIYPETWIWDTVYNFCSQAMSPSYNAATYRNYIVQNYNTVDQVKRIDEVLNSKDEPAVLFKDGPVDPIKLSVVMIMKNEEKHIARCLDSVRDIADEIVIVDTGSTDKSMTIAKKYGAKIHQYPWEDDFSLHRNQSIEYATGDWLLVMDADNELVGDKDGLKTTLSKLGDEYNEMAVNLKGADVEVGNEVNASRVFRNGHIQYRRAWHNMPVVDGTDKVGAILYNDATIIHYGSAEQLDEAGIERKNKRNKVLLAKSLEQDPNDHGLYFYMMHSYGIEEKWEKAVEYGEKYLAHRNEIATFQLSAFYTLIRMHSTQLNNINRALELLHQAKKLLPEDLDIAFVECELGMLNSNGMMMLAGARNYVRLYKLYKEKPDAKGGRFLFHLKPESLLFCLKHMTSYLMKDGVECLKLLQGSIAEFLPEQRVGVEKEIAEMLEPLGVSVN